MGVVYKAYDSDIDREVAIKVLHSHHMAGDMGEDFLRRFANEVKAAARCQHPNIVTIYDCAINGAQPYMVMEYVKGINLEAFLRSKQLLSAAQAINLILKVLEALNSAHAMNIVHRDIKPANIMVLDNGQVKVTDFGVAHIDNSDLTQLGDVMGTPSYMSPEAKAGGLVAANSDLYSTALVLFELLINKRVKSLLLDYSIIIDALIAQDFEQKLASNLALVLNKALKQEPQQRYQDALSFSKALADCLEHSPDSFQISKDLATTVLTVKNVLQQQLEPPQTNPSSLSLSANVLSEVQTQLSIVEKSLTHRIGPVAKVLVKKQSKKTDNISQLVNSLLEFIPTDIERQQFINDLNLSINSKIEKPSPFDTHSHSSGLTSCTEYIERLTSELTLYLGPVAKHLVKSTLKKASSEADLSKLLAEKIPNLAERAEFLKKAAALASKSYRI